MKALTNEGIMEAFITARVVKVLQLVILTVRIALVSIVRLLLPRMGQRQQHRLLPPLP